MKALRRGCVFSTISLILTACGGTPPTIATQPTNQSVVAGQVATFSVTANGPGAFNYQWHKGTTPIADAIFASYTTPPASTFDNGSMYSVVVSNSSGSVTSKAATLSVSAQGSTDVLTYHNDIARTGQNLTETTLTPSNVVMSKFGKIGFYAVDGLVDAEPLYAANVEVPGKGKHNLLIAATENDSVYAFDADSGSTIWQVRVLKSGETASPDPPYPTNPWIGVNATPVIDRNSGPNGAIYLVASSALTQNSTTTYYQRLHALDLALGTELFAGPVDIQGTYPGTGDNSDGTNVVFDPSQYRERAALLLLNGVVYMAWASHFDIRPYTGWIMGYSESTLVQKSILNITPNGNKGAIWMSGAGLAADPSGNIYLLASDGIFDSVLNSSGFPSEGDYGNAFLKLSASENLSVSDYFEMEDQSENANDADLGSGGVLVLPDLLDSSGHSMHLAIGAGKDRDLYLVNRDSMGKFSSNNNSLYQEIEAVFPIGVWAAPAYFNGTVYYGSNASPILAFRFKNAKLSTTPSSKTATTFYYPGASPSISANGTSNGIVWAVENSTPAILHAYDAQNLNELYNSNQATGGRDQFGAGNKFITPMIANGKVFVGTPNGVAVFGLLP